MSRTGQDQYVRAVGRYLSGLSRAQRRELLDDLAANLAETPKPDYHSYLTTFGNPDSYAVELRRAAGLSPPPPIRRSTLVATLVVLAMAASAFGFLHWARNFDPLEIGSGCFSSEPPGVDTMVGVLRNRTIVYADGTPVRVVWPLNNLSGTAITITHLDIPRAPLWLISNQTIGLGPAKDTEACPSQQATPFHRFVLHAHAFRNIVLTGTFGGCEYYAPGDALGIEEADLTTEVDGIAHSFKLPLQPYLTIALAAEYRCPRSHAHP
jgi:hypothetical protein